MNTSCCTWINVIGQVTVNIKEMYIQSEWHHNFGKGDVASMVLSTVKKKKNSALPKLTQFLHFLGPLMAIVVLLSSVCLFNLVSSGLQWFEISLMMAQGPPVIPVESGPCTYRSLEQSGRDFY